MKAIDKSEVTQGLFLPCITYGKAQFALNQAQKDRAGDAGAKDAKFHALNKHCIGYAAACTVLPCKSMAQMNARDAATELHVADKSLKGLAEES